jgi:NAD-reducing hydrogenase large subunit
MLDGDWSSDVCSSDLIAEMTQWALDALALARNYTLEHADLVKTFAAFPSSHMSLVRQDGAHDLYDGHLRALDCDGTAIFDTVDYRTYHERLVEDVRSWSYMKFPFIKALGPEAGWYRVGPTARMNTADFIDTPLADDALKAFKAVTAGKPNNTTLSSHWARMIEVLHCVEKIHELLIDPDLQGTDLVATGDRREEGIGVIEAPRGNLIHHYKVDENNQVTYCNLIVSTTHNNEGMNRAVKDVAVRYLDRQPEITEAMLNHIEVAIRAYDPCLSCATHALGQMPLQVELFDADGALLASRAQSF